MIQTTSPPAASRKWLRINGGRIRLPTSDCWRIPPRISQIESSTKPPPAVITQAISAAHFITPPFDSRRRAKRSLENDRLYTSPRYLSSMSWWRLQLPVNDEQHAAVRVVAQAIGCLAGDFSDVRGFERSGE